MSDSHNLGVVRAFEPLFFRVILEEGKEISKIYRKMLKEDAKTANDVRSKGKQPKVNTNDPFAPQVEATSPRYGSGASGLPAAGDGLDDGPNLDSSQRAARMTQYGMESHLDLFVNVMLTSQPNSYLRSAR